MARVTLVQKARKAQGSCRRCDKPIEAGDSYYHFSNRIGRSSVRKVFCKDHRPRASEMTTSDKLSQLYAAQEQVDDALAALNPAEAEVDDFESIRDDAAQTVRDVAQEYEESADNIVDGFGHDTYVSDDIREKAQEVESWADEIEAVDFDDFEEDDLEDHDPEDQEMLAEVDQRGEWFEEQSSKLTEVTGMCPV